MDGKRTRAASTRASKSSADSPFPKVIVIVMVLPLRRVSHDAVTLSSGPALMGTVIVGRGFTHDVLMIKNDPAAKSNRIENTNERGFTPVVAHYVTATDILSSTILKQIQQRLVVIETLGVGFGDSR